MAWLLNHGLTTSVNRILAAMALLDSLLITAVKPKRGILTREPESCSSISKVDALRYRYQSHCFVELPGMFP